MADLAILRKININGEEHWLGLNDVELAKLNGIAEGAQVNVLEGVQVDGSDLSIADKKVNIDLATPIKNAVDAAKTELNGTISGVDAKAEQNKTDIATLKGTGEGSIDAKITAAFDDFATKVSDDQVVNTYKELIDYAAEHGAEFTELVGTVNANKQAADTGIQEAKDAAATADGKAVAAQSAAEAAQSTADGVRTDLGTKEDSASSEGSAFARIAQLKADLSSLSGDGGTVSEQINTAITNYDTNTVQPIAGRVSTAETKLAGISEGANKVTMGVEGSTLMVTIA